MQKKQHLLVLVPVIAALALSVATGRADHEKRYGTAAEMKASDVIGKEVKNNQNETLGKVDDLIVNSESGTVPFAIIAHGGALGVGRTKTAVPMSSLRCSSDHKTFILPTTKEELKMASRSPAGAWSNVKDAEWAKNIDGYYGEPGKDADPSRLYVRDPLPKGAELLARPADTVLCERICESIENVQVSVDNGVATLTGSVESDTDRQNLEAKVKSIQGVQRVDNRLQVRKSQ
jgi:sporulation protein YlmC with PRC-barrel domain